MRWSTVQAEGSNIHDVAGLIAAGADNKTVNRLGSYKFSYFGGESK